MYLGGTVWIHFILGEIWVMEKSVFIIVIKYYISFFIRVLMRA